MASPTIIQQVSQSLGSGIFDGVAKIISMFKVPPELQVEKAIELQKIQEEMTVNAQNAAQRVIDDATENIKAEAAQGSKARPLFMYLIEFVLFFDLIFAPLWNSFSKANPIATLPLPSNLLMLFGVCICGYTCFDQIQKIMSLPGSSSFSIPGFKVSNDSKGASNGIRNR